MCGRNPEVQNQAVSPANASSILPEDAWQPRVRHRAQAHSDLPETGRCVFVVSVFARGNGLTIPPICLTRTFNRWVRGQERTGLGSPFGLTRCRHGFSQRRWAVPWIPLSPSGAQGLATDIRRLLRRPVGLACEQPTSQLGFPLGPERALPVAGHDIWHLYRRAFACNK